MTSLKIRKAGNRSRFYPYDGAQIDQMITDWEKMRSQYLAYSDQLKNPLKVAIVPHAGYIYSGYTAYCAYRELKASKFDRIIIVGPSHHIRINGISIADHDVYETPYGDIMIDTDYTEYLESNFDVDFQEKAHYLEHSTETQMPFIKKIFPDIKIVEIIYGNISPDTLYELFDFILKDAANGLIISTDLSHFHDLDSANKIDNKTIEALLKNNSKSMSESGEACGKTGLLGIMKYMTKHDIQINLMDYRTSATTSGDSSRVVGYMSAVF